MSLRIVLWRDRFDQNQLLVVEAKSAEAALRKAVKEAEAESGEDFDEESEFVEVLDMPPGFVVWRSPVKNKV